MRNVRRVILAALAVMTAATGVLVIVSEPAQANPTGPAISADPCRDGDGVRTRTVTVGGVEQEQAFVLTYSTPDIVETNWDPSRPTDPGHSPARIIDRYRPDWCLDHTGAWCSYHPTVSGELRCAEKTFENVPESLWQRRTVGGISWLFYPGMYHSHQVRWPLVWPDRGDVTLGTVTGVLLVSGGIAPQILRNVGEACEFQMSATCHENGPTGYIGGLSREYTGVHGRYHGAAVNLKSNTAGGLLVRRNNPCSWSAAQAAVNSAPPSERDRLFANLAGSRNLMCKAVVDTYTDALGRSAYSQHQTVMSGLSGRWVPCADLTVDSARENGCNSNGNGDDGDDGDDGDCAPVDCPEPPCDPATDPYRCGEPPQPCTSMIADDCCVTAGNGGSCSTTPPGDDPPEFYTPDPGPQPCWTERPSDPGPGFAAAGAAASATGTPAGSAPWREAWQNAFDAWVAANTRTVCTPWRAPQWPSPWPQDLGARVIHENSWLPHHPSTGDFQHWGTTTAWCTGNVDCDTHPEIVVYCETDGCAMPAGRQRNGNAWWEVDIESYEVVNQGMVSFWKDDRVNPAHRGHYNSFDWWNGSDWDGSPDAGQVQSFTAGRWRNLTSTGVAFTNSTTGGNGTSQRLTFVTEVVFTGKIHAYGIDQWGVAHNWSVPFRQNAEVVYIHGDGSPFNREVGFTIGHVRPSDLNYPG